MEETKKYSLEEQINLYKNYLYSLQEQKEHGDKYGDTDEIIKMYEKKLKKTLKKDNIDTL